ncbi:uncharacterized protein LOC130284175 isoform X2 [Hyla sarda]|uniref:uncharacterized protein LOC130284175 isoform X2 n=1 Tax=Hyla sarda TaxID=327740 RepID=UPI0024C3706F|nr:uncharacterized protein LOC130284175 isoform X2 [Hyla sarda]
MGCNVEDEFPKKTGLYSVTDLRSLAAALGFPSNSLESCLPSGSLCKGIITSKELHRLLDLGYFTSALHFTFNMKSGLYNVKLILKCLNLLDRSALSFAAVQEAKVAFCAYEHLDQKGVKAETNTLLKAIKMCGFAVSSQKLSMYVRQNRSSFVEPGRVQLYEFLDLLTICEPKNKFSIQEERVPSTDKTSRGLYQMDDMRTAMMTPDEKLAHHLNRRFQHVDSWMLPQETIATAQPLTSRKCQRTENLNGRRPHPPKRRNESSHEGTTDEPWTIVTPVPQLRCHCYTPKREKPIQTKQDIQKTKNNIEELLYEMETLGEKTRWDLNWKLDYYLPGYRERSATRHVSAVPQPPKTIKKKSCKDDVFKRLSASRRRIPSPCHAISCDAHKLGIADKTQKERLKCSTATLHGSQKY